MSGWTGATGQSSGVFARLHVESVEFEEELRGDDGMETSWLHSAGESLSESDGEASL